MKRTLAAVGVSTALLFAVASPASAETSSGGTPSTSELTLDGAGTEAAEASADGTTGALNANAKAVGGNSLLPLFIRGFLPPNIIPGQGPSSASAIAGVNKLIEVGPGTYEVTVTYEDARRTAVQTGVASPGAYAQTSVTSAETHQTTFDALPVATGDVVLTYVVEVPEGSENLSVSANVIASAYADGAGNTADSTATVGQTSYEVVPV